MSNIYNEQGVPNGTDGLYFEAFLINPGNEGYDYVPNATLALEKVRNDRKRRQHGARSDFLNGGNYKNKLFVGASLGINSINYRSTKTYNEEFLDDNDQSTLFSSLQEKPVFWRGSRY